MFVGGLSPSTTLEDVSDFFSGFGQVQDCNIVYRGSVDQVKYLGLLIKDHLTKRHRGFGFVTFVEAETAVKVVNIRWHEINNKTV